MSFIKFIESPLPWLDPQIIIFIQAQLASGNKTKSKITQINKRSFHALVRPEFSVAFMKVPFSSMAHTTRSTEVHNKSN